MTYTEIQAVAATSAIDKYRSGETGEIGAALAVVGLSAERAEHETRIRDDMIRVGPEQAGSIFSRLEGRAWCREACHSSTRSDADVEIASSPGAARSVF